MSGIFCRFDFEGFSGGIFLEDFSGHFFPAKSGLGLGGVAFMTVLAVALPSLCLSYKIQRQETTVTVLTALAVSAVVAVSVVTATPLKLNPPFRHPDKSEEKRSGDKIREKKHKENPAAQRRIRDKSALPKTDPNNGVENIT